MIFLRCWQKITVNLEFYNQQKCPSKMKVRTFASGQDRVTGTILPSHLKQPLPTPMEKTYVILVFRIDLSSSVRTYSLICHLWKSYKLPAIVPCLSAPAPSLLPFTARQLRSPVGTHRLHCPPQSPSRPLQSGVLPHHPTSQLLEVAGSFRVAHSHVHFAVLILASQQRSTPSPSRKPFL